MALSLKFAAVAVPRTLQLYSMLVYAINPQSDSYIEQLKELENMKPHTGERLNIMSGLKTLVEFNGPRTGRVTWCFAPQPGHLM